MLSRTWLHANESVGSMPEEDDSGSTLIIKNTFIEFKFCGTEASNAEGSCQRRAQSSPATGRNHGEPVERRQRTATCGAIFARSRLRSLDASHCAVVENLSQLSTRQEPERIIDPSSPLSCGEEESVETASNACGNCSGASLTSEASSSRWEDSSSCGAVERIKGSVTFAEELEQMQVQMSNDRTTVILRNIPDEYTRTMLLDTLDRQGFNALFDFLYLPINFGTQRNFGYAFINFQLATDAELFMLDIQGFHSWSAESKLRAYAEWSDGGQGLQAQIERYRNSAMMHCGVSDEAKPIILQDGVRVEFPAPTRPLKPLRVRAWKKEQPQCISLG